MPVPEYQSIFFAIEQRDLALPLLVTGMGVNHSQYKVVRENGYECYHYFRCTAGEGAVEAGQQRFVLRRNMGMILFPGEPHLYYPTQEPWLVDWVTFDGGSVAAVLSYLEIDRSTAFDHPYPKSRRPACGNWRS